jgi:hypothetical protein
MMIRTSSAGACALFVVGLLVSPIEAGAKSGAAAPAFSPGFARGPIVRPAVQAPAHVPAPVVRGHVGTPRQFLPQPRVTGSIGVRPVGVRHVGDTFRASRRVVRPYGLGLPIWGGYSQYAEPSVIVVAPPALDPDAEPGDVPRVIPAAAERPRSCRSETVTVPSESGGGRHTVNILRC